MALSVTQSVASHKYKNVHPSSSTSPIRSILVLRTTGSVSFVTGGSTNGDDRCSGYEYDRGIIIVIGLVAHAILRWTD